MLILGSAMMWNANARAQTAAPSPQPAPAAAQAAPQTADNPVGSVATLQGSASVTHSNATHPLALSDPIYKGDTLQTGIDGTLGITFDDETTFTLKPNARIAVDDFVYQDGGSNNAADVQRAARHRGVRRRRSRPYRRHEDQYADVVARHSRHHRHRRDSGRRRRRRRGVGQALSRRRRPGRPHRSVRPRWRVARRAHARRHRLCGAAGRRRPLCRGAVADLGAGSGARSLVRAPDLCHAHHRPPDQHPAPQPAAAAQSAAAQSTAAAKPVAGTRAAAWIAAAA